MMAILSAQKTHYNQMKLLYNQSQLQIRTLERQIGAMHRELDVCSNMFLNADKTFRSKLNGRIDTLLCENEKLTEKLEWTERKLIETAAEKNITWLESMLTYCKNETAQFTNDLHACRLKLAATDEQLRDSEDNQSRWRFEALKLRCLLLNRESLLEANRIPFKSDAAADERQIKSRFGDAPVPNIHVDVTNIRRVSLSTMENKEITKVPDTRENKENTKVQEKDVRKPIEVVPKKVRSPAKPEIGKLLSPQIPKYRTIYHTPESLAKLNANWMKVKEQEARKPLTEQQQFASKARDLFPSGAAGGTKKNVNFSEKIEESNEAVKRTEEVAKEVNMPPPPPASIGRNCITKRVFIKSKFPKQ